MWCWIQKVSSWVCQSYLLSRLEGVLSYALPHLSSSAVVSFWLSNCVLSWQLGNLVHFLSRVSKVYNSQLILQCFIAPHISQELKMLHMSVHPNTPEMYPYLLQVIVFITVRMQHAEMSIPHFPTIKWLLVAIWLISCPFAEYFSESMSDPSGHLRY